MGIEMVRVASLQDVNTRDDVSNCQFYKTYDKTYIIYGVMTLRLQEIQ